MRTTGDRPAGRLWWAGPTALVVLGGTTFAFVLAPELSGNTRIPDRVVIRPASTESAAATHNSRPSQRPTTRPDSTQAPSTPPTTQPPAPPTQPDNTVVQPTRPVVSESPDDNGGSGGDDGGGQHDRHGETAG